MSTLAIDRFLQAYERKTGGRPVKRQGRNRWNLKCPAHTDDNPSLSVTVKPDGKLLVNCLSGCAIKNVLKSLGLELKHLYPCGGNLSLTLLQYSKLKCLPMDFLQRNGVRDCEHQNRPAVAMDYRDESGSVVSTRYRVGPTKAFKWKTGDEAILYGLWRLPDARKSGQIIIVEGESDCHTLWYHGYPAVGLPGAVNWQEARDARHFEAIATILVVIEPDKGGEAVLDWLRRSGIRDRVKLIHPEPFKDTSAMYLDAPDLFRDRFDAALKEAVPWHDPRRRLSTLETIELTRNVSRSINCRPDLTARDRRVLLALAMLTISFGRKVDRVAVVQIVAYSGLPDTKVFAVLQNLANRGLVSSKGGGSKRGDSAQRWINIEALMSPHTGETNDASRVADANDSKKPEVSPARGDTVVKYVEGLIYPLGLPLSGDRTP